jgi:hypothetical protein
MLTKARTTARSAARLPSDTTGFAEYFITFYAGSFAVCMLGSAREERNKRR